MGRRDRTPDRKKSSKPKVKLREHFTEENWARWTNKQRLAFIQNQYDVLTAPDGKIAKAVAATDADIAMLADTVSLLKLHVEADENWAKWSMEEKLAHERKLHKRYKQDQVVYGSRRSATDAEIKAIEERIEYFEHQISGTSNWSSFSDNEMLAWLRKTYSMLTVDGGKFATATRTPREYIDEIALRIAIIECRQLGEAQFDSWDSDQQILHSEKLYYLYTRNNNQGARIHGKSQEFLDRMRSDIANMKKTASNLKLIEQRAQIEADKLLKKIDQHGRRSPTITREDILGKKGH